MGSISSIQLSGQKREKQEAREALGVDYDLAARTKDYSALFDLLGHITLGELDRKVKHGDNLTFEESFVGACTVLAATNQHFYQRYLPAFNSAYGSFSREKALALAAAFLNLMAAKESFTELTPEEIAGMVAAAKFDTVIALDVPSIIETCGMGGDRGLLLNGEITKTINASTLSSLVLAGLGLPAVKHGSYANTSKVGSTEAIEILGANTSVYSERKVLDILSKAGYCFFDAHWCKTIHDLSHLLMMETINHIIGPMTPPISRNTLFNKVMGVNEKVHPETVARAYAILAKKGHQATGGVVVLAGLDAMAFPFDPTNYAYVKRHTTLDEFSPYGTVVAVSHGSEYLGLDVLTPNDFGIVLHPEDIAVPGDRVAIERANLLALTGNNSALADYLALNAALGIFAIEYAGRPDCFQKGRINRVYLRECFVQARDCIASGKAYKALQRYVRVSNEHVVAVS